MPQWQDAGRADAANESLPWPVGKPSVRDTDGPALQMTHTNVGSLVVFDASKVTVDRAASKVINATQDAVVGIFTERGELGTARQGRACAQALTACCARHA